jgi:hypothetical protein
LNETFHHYPFFLGHHYYSSSSFCSSFFCVNSYRVINWFFISSILLLWF